MASDMHITAVLMNTHRVGEGGGKVRVWGVEVRWSLTSISLH